MLLIHQVPSSYVANYYVAHPIQPSASDWMHHRTSASTLTASVLSSSSNLLAGINDGSQMLQLLSSYKSYGDTVKRVIDSSTIQLTSGYVTLDTVRGAGSTYTMPECMDKAPAYKLRGLLSKGTAVKVYDLNPSSSESNGPRRVWIVRSSDDLVINRELVKSGYAFVRKGGGSSSNAVSEIVQELNDLERSAKRNGLGIFKICSEGSSNATDENGRDASSTTAANSNFIAEFEPLEYTTQTQWLEDGGKTIVVPKQSTPAMPSNPGDTKGCSDFETYEDALGYYEMYYPYYGDVAKLDRQGKGVPCSGLPHTKNMDRYRMKRPSANGEAVGSNVSLN